MLKQRITLKQERSNNELLFLTTDLFVYPRSKKFHELGG